MASKHPRLFARRRSPLFSLWPWILLGVLIGVGADAWVQLHRPLWLPLPFTIEVSKGEQLDSVLQRLEQRGVMLTVLPCMAFMVAPKELPARLLPNAARDGDALAVDFVRFAMAGLQALAKAHRPARPKAAASLPSKP